MKWRPCQTCLTSQLILHPWSAHSPSPGAGENLTGSWRAHGVETSEQRPPINTYCSPFPRGATEPKGNPHENGLLTHETAHSSKGFYFRGKEIHKKLQGMVKITILKCFSTSGSVQSLPGKIWACPHTQVWPSLCCIFWGDLFPEKPSSPTRAPAPSCRSTWCSCPSLPLCRLEPSCSPFVFPLIFTFHMSTASTLCKSVSHGRERQIA